MRRLDCVLQSNGKSGALCVYRLRDGYSPPILYECESGDFIDECGCITKTSNGCSCSVNGASSNVTVVNGQFTCVPDDSESMKSGVPIGIPIGVTLTLIVLLVVLVAGLIWWRRREKRNNEGNDMPPTENTHVIGSDTFNVNPTFGLDEDHHVTEDILKPVAVVGPRPLKSDPNNVLAEIKPNDRSASAAGTSEGESYATIQSAGYTPYNPKGQKDVYTALQGTKNSNEDGNAPIPSTGYTAYKPKRGNDVYTDLKKTGNDDDDDPAVYTPILNNGPKQDKDDPENEYVDPENVTVAASGQWNGAKGVKAPVLLSKPNNLTKDSGYVDVDAPSVVFTDGSKPSARTKKPSGGSGYVSVDSPSASFHNNQDENPENNYYFKLEEPTADDEDDYSLASAPGVNDYDTFNRAGGKRPSANSPTDDGVYNLTSVPEDNEYNTFNRPGVRRPSNNAPTDDGLYSLTNPPGDDEYSTFDRLGNRGPSANAPSDEGVYSLTGPPEGDVYSTSNRVGKKPTPGAPAINNESEYSTLD
ncbi:uncharacterized protein LOC119729845 [Patiria miniata]|uniref:Uncharacterized protein n=1 Tax=Patiria miniata TaxID=46514 RepID=A0A914A585_PATMI|nr:uncharacterized protein LOC119729845 [Patiria miniata]